MSNQQVTKKQHYVSRGLLRHFSIDGERIFECSIDRHKVYLTNIANSMEEKNTYEHPLLEENSLEDAFAEIESTFIPIISSIINKLDSDTKNIADIYNQLIPLFEIFLLFYYRSGAVLSEFCYGINDTEVRKQLRVSRLLEIITNRVYLKELATSLHKGYAFSILHTDTSEFVISDQYIATVALAFKNHFINSSNRAIGMKDTMILLPLSYSWYIVLFNGDAPSYIKADQICYLTQEEVFQINKIIFHNSFRKCAGKSKETLESLLSEKYSSYGVSEAFFETKDGNYGGYTNKKEIFLYDDDREIKDYFIQYAIKYRELKDQYGKAHLRNIKCPCKSGKKFKSCCLSKYERAFHAFEATQKSELQNYHIPGCISEMPIYEFWYNGNLK